MTAFFIFTGALNVFAVDSVSAADRLELRQRLDSLEVEKQTLKRMGKPLSELESAASQLRDTLKALRGHTAPSSAASSDKSFSLPFALPFSLPSWVSQISSFTPRNAFDWFIVAVGVVALLSGFLLVIGIIYTARAKKRRARAAAPKAKSKDKPKEKPVSKRINLAPQENYPAALAPEIPKITPMPAPAPTSAAAPQTPPPAFGGYDFSGRLNGQLKTEARDKKEISNDDKVLALLRDRILAAPDPQKETAATPLFVTADQPPPPPPKMAPASIAPPAGASAQELIMAASQEGLNAQEISKRHQISIDQVNLILRMAKK